jgi:hypothetical protein
MGVVQIDKQALRIGLLFSAIVIFSAIACHADDALVLPKGVFRVNFDGNFYLPIHKRYNPDKGVEDLAVDFNANLNSNVFPALAPLDPFVPGLPSIGDSHVKFEYNVQTLESSLQYGLTDKLTLGVNVPFWWFHNKVTARVDSGPGSSANVGKNPALACGSPICPLFVPGTTRFTTQDVQQLLGKGLTIGPAFIPGFRFKEFKSWTGSGVSDIETGARYQYWRSEDWRLAFTGGVRFPTGRVDDPDNLTDYAFGSGAYALLFRLNNDFIVSNLWKTERAFKDQPTAGAIVEPGDVVLNGSFRYDVYLPDDQRKRVSNDVNQPLTTNSEKVHRNLGDIFEYELSAKYGLLEGLQASALYKYSFKLRDQISGKMGFNYKSLEDETAAKSHIIIIGLSYSTLPLFLQKKFPLPITASLSYRNRVAGSNNVLKSQYIGFALSSLF